MKKPGRLGAVMGVLAAQGELLARPPAELKRRRQVFLNTLTGELAIIRSTSFQAQIISAETGKRYLYRTCRLPFDNIPEGLRLVYLAVYEMEALKYLFKIPVVNIQIPDTMVTEEGLRTYMEQLQATEIPVSVMDSAANL